MTNGDRIRSMSDDELAVFIFENVKAFTKCSMCRLGLDDKNRCLTPHEDCVEAIKFHLKTEESYEVRKRRQNGKSSRSL